MEFENAWIVVDVSETGVKTNPRYYHEGQRLKPGEEKIWRTIKLISDERPSLYLRRRLELHLLTGDLMIEDQLTWLGAAKATLLSFLRKKKLNNFPC